MRIFRRAPAAAVGTEGIDTLLRQQAAPAPAVPAEGPGPAGPVGGTGTPLARPADRPPVRSEDVPVDERLDRLAGGVDGSRKRRGNARDVRRIMHLIGMVAIGCGIAAVILGWYGASHSPYLYQEVPYLISGGLLGLALVFAGGAVYAGSWALRQIQEGHRDAQAMVRSVERLERTIRASMAAPLDRSEDAPAMANGNGHSSGHGQGPGPGERDR